MHNHKYFKQQISLLCVFSIFSPQAVCNHVCVDERERGQGYGGERTKLTVLSKILRLVKTIEEFQTHRNYCCSYPCRLHFVSNEKQN